jgi:hypothetical protein
MVTTPVTLLSTAHCTMCDEALDMLFGMPELAGRRLSVVDVAEDAALIERYGERLPVLRIGQRELDWPFDRDDVAAALR